MLAFDGPFDVGGQTHPDGLRGFVSEEYDGVLFDVGQGPAGPREGDLPGGLRGTNEDRDWVITNLEIWRMGGYPRFDDGAGGMTTVTVNDVTITNIAGSALDPAGAWVVEPPETPLTMPGNTQVPTGVSFKPREHGN